MSSPFSGPTLTLAPLLCEQAYRNELKGKVVGAELDHGAALEAGDVVRAPGALAAAAGSPAYLSDLLPSFLSGLLGGKKAALPKAAPKRPRVVVVSGAALRCCALVPALRRANKHLGDGSGGHVAKLFAKHQKVSEQAEELAKENCSMVVGTPNRLLRLLDDGALILDECRLFVLDATHADAKTFTLLTLPGVAADLMHLFRAHVLPLVEAQKSKDEERDSEKQTGATRVVFI